MISDREEIRAVVVAPTYNNARTLRNILQRVDQLQLPVLIVNDGSTDETASILSDWQRDRKGGWCQVETHPTNRGKAAALRTAFASAHAAGFTHGVTIDTDGQLDPEQIPSLLEVARVNPASLIVGNRDDTAADYPTRSRLGRRISNTFVFIESGVRVEDSQCGLRVYPLGLVTSVKSRAQYFGFETEIITRAGWAGCQVIGVPVRCRYLPPHQRVSHFRPWVDSIRSVLMHFRLVGRALLPLPHPKWPSAGPRPNGAFLDNPEQAIPSVAAHLPNRLSTRAILKWFDPRIAWTELHDQHIGRTTAAGGIAVGVFIANLPAYGFQTLLGIYTARRLHLNPLSVVLGTQISTPPLNAIMSAAAIICGHVLLHGRLPVLAEYNLSHINLRQVALPLIADWTVGGIVLGLITGAAAFFISSYALKLFFESRASAHSAISNDRDCEIFQRGDSALLKR